MTRGLNFSNVLGLDGIERKGEGLQIRELQSWRLVLGSGQDKGYGDGWGGVRKDTQRGRTRQRTGLYISILILRQCTNIHTIDTCRRVIT